MQSEDESEHMKNMELSQMNAAGKKKQKKISHYRNSKRYFMTLIVQRINVGSYPKYRKGHNTSPSHRTRKRQSLILVRLPVSGSKCKETVSHHSLLTARKKLKKTTKSTTLLGSVRGWRDTGKIAAPKIGEGDRQIQGVTAYKCRDSRAETSLDTSARVGNMNCN